MFNSFNVAKAETQIRLCNARIKLQKNKKTIAVKQMRKEVADLLRNNKPEYARIRVEGVIRENLLMQAYEILELYLELVAVRAQLIAKTKEIPRDMVEAVSSIIYAASRISDVPELVALRTLFANKYGKEYVAEATSDVTCSNWQVNANLIRCLLVEPPQPEEKLAMLSEIAQEHGVEWDLSAAAREMLPPGMQPNGGLVMPVMPPMAAGGAGPGAAPPPPPSLPTPQGMDPRQAAAAAAAAAAHARAMADWAGSLAAQYAQVQGTGSTAPPPQGWLAAMSHDGPAPGNRGPGSGSGSGSGGGGSGGGGGVAVPAPKARTEEEIQRAYDAAIGPPTKGAIPPPIVPTASTDQRLPTAPPAGASTTLPSVPPPSPPSADVNNHPQLPRPPQGLPSAQGPEDEYDELSRRLEALKRT